MATAYSKVGNFVRGCLGRDGRLLLELSDRNLAQQKAPHSFFLVWDNGRLSKPIRVLWSTAAIVHTGWPDAEFVAVGTFGQLMRLRRDGTTSEVTLFRPGHIAQRGPLRGAACIGGGLYCVGAAHQALRVAPDWSVTDISIPQQMTSAQPDSVGLEAVQGFTPEEIYAAGWEGEIWRYAGQRWQRVGGPTNAILTAIVCAPDDHVYVVGQQGTVLVGRGDQWTPVLSPIKENLWSAAWFFDALHASSSQQLFTMDKGQMRSVELPDQPQSFFWLDSNAKAMLSTGADDVLLLLRDRVLRIV
ncbi:MAG: WD40/YVTN/BNR-like repeat-containing protein [Steroidobacteraceae bacterium]